MKIEGISDEKLLEQQEKIILDFMRFLSSMDDILATGIVSDKERVQGAIAEMNELYERWGQPNRLEYTPSPVVYLSDYKRQRY